MKCIKGKETQVLKSAAGYYIGTFDEEGPYCRCSQYYKAKEEAQTVLNNKSFYRCAAEIEFCNGGWGCFTEDDPENKE